VRIPAYVFLGIWFLFQLVEGNFGLFSAQANGGGTAFVAHVGSLTVQSTNTPTKGGHHVQ
jgi:hypothetical protein